MISKVSEKIRDLVSSNNLYIGALNFGRSVMLASVVVTTLVVATRHLGTLQPLELTTFDQLIRMRPDAGPDNRLLLVAITEEDIQSRKEDPIYDSTLAQVLEKIEQYQPRAIGIDILRDVPQGTGRAALTERLAKSDRIIAVCKVSSVDNPGIPPAPGIPEDRVGFADFPLDSDGVVRRGLLILTATRPAVPAKESHVCNNPDPENQLASLALQLAILYLKPLGIEPQPIPSGDMKIGSTVFKRLVENDSAYKHADMGGYQFLINYRSPRELVKQISLSDVLAGKLTSDLVKDRVVLVGYTAPSKKDDFLTPYSAGQQDNQRMPGVVVHAQVVSQILSAALNKQPLIWFWPEWGEVLWIFGWSLVGGTLAWRIRKPLFLGLAEVAGIGILFGTCSYFLMLRAGWIPLAPPVLALVATTGIIVLLERGGAKAIVKRMKLMIGIDQAKKEEEIAKLAETVDLESLRQKGQDLRKQRQGGLKEREKSDRSIQPRSESESSAEDYLSELQSKAKLIKNRDSDGHIEPAIVSNNETTDAMQPSSESQPPSAFDYLAQMPQQAKRSPQESEPPASEISKSEETLTNSSSPAPSVFDYLAPMPQQVKRSPQESEPPASEISKSEETLTNSASPAPSVFDYLAPMPQQAKRSPQESELPASDVSQSEETLASSSSPAPSVFDYLAPMPQQAGQVENSESEPDTSSARYLNSRAKQGLDAPQEPQRSEELDFVGDLQQKAKHLKNSQIDARKDLVTSSNAGTIEHNSWTISERKSNSKTTQASEDISEPEIPLEMDYFYQLQLIAKELRDKDKEA